MNKLAYLVTVSQKHVLPASMLLRTLIAKTSAEIYLVGNLSLEQQHQLTISSQIRYIDENEIDFSGRMPNVQWQAKYREWGWYKQMFIRLCCDRFIPSEQVVILDSEVFFFDSWDEQRLYTPDGHPKCFYWVAQQRKSDWDYAMYQGAAYPYKDLPGFENVMGYAASDSFRRHISGVVLFSTRNVRHIWETLAHHTDLEKSMHSLFHEEPSFSFSDHDFYGIAMDYGLCEGSAKTVPSPELLGWYDNHNDVVFHQFAIDRPMWSMCQHYMHFPTHELYSAYMQDVAAMLHQQFPEKIFPLLVEYS